jgi:AraC-like DNA-binding protein/quercetin dioxygenase-like cupin family protein
MHQRLRPVEVQLPDYGVFVLESHHAPGFRMAPSRHDFLEVFYVLRGTGTFTIAGRDYPGRPDNVLVVPAGRVHSITDDPARPMSLYGICLAPRVYQIEPGLSDALPAGPLVLNELLVPRIRADLRQLLFEQTLARAGHRLVLVGLALQLLGLLVRGRPVGSRTGPLPAVAPYSAHLPAVQRYVADLPQRFFEPSDLDHIAAALGMSRRRFTQLFRTVAGTSWLDYLTRLRMDYACQLLRQTQRSVVAVAFECGYEDLSSFYRVFKRHTGLPPKEWRGREGKP